MNDGPNHPVAKTFPASQCNAQLGNVDDSFRVFAGGRFYNFSVVDFDTINLQGRLDYKNTFVGGTYAPIDSNFITYYFNTPITTLDSLLYLKLDTINGNLAGFDMNDAPKGMYKMENTVLALPFTETGLSQLNNQWTYTYAITDSVYSKCEYDFSKNAHCQLLCKCSSYQQLSVGTCFLYQKWFIQSCKSTSCDHERCN